MEYASAQFLDFLARTKNPSFPARKPAVSHPGFSDGNYLIYRKEFEQNGRKNYHP
jgi:hypothetical protein